MSIILSESFFNEIEKKGDCLDSITSLIKQGMDINSTFKAIISGKETTQSLLSYACHQNCTKITKMLIDRGANVNYKTFPDEDTPMHIACRKYNSEIVSFLLQIPSINLNSLNKNNELCFSIALQTSQTEIYSMIIKVINEQKLKEIKIDQNGFNMKDIRRSFKYNKLKETIEIPFSFQNMDSACAKSLNGIIRLSQTPSLMIDFDSLENSEKINNENRELKERVSALEKELEILSNENNKLKNEAKELNSSLKASKEEISSLKIGITETIINRQSDNNSTKEESLKTLDLDLLYYSINNTDNYLQSKFQPKKQSLENIKSSLQKDLTDYRDYIKLNISKTENIIHQLLIQLQYAVDELSSNYEIKLYGSRATQLCLLWSDLDIVIFEKKESRPNCNSPKKKHINPYVLLDLLSISLTAKLWVSSLKYISTAKIPIIKLITTGNYSSMQIDISIQDSTHCGLECVDLVNSYINEYNALEPLVLAIKTFLKLSLLNDPFTGGLSSYGIILMIVSFLRKEKMLNKPIGLDNLGDLLCGFLFYYGERRETNFVNVSNVNMTCTSISPYELIIVDPLNIKNNVGKSTFHYVSIKLSFLIALQALSEECPCGCHYSTNNNCSKECVQQNALKKMFNAVKRGNINIINNI